MRKQRQRSGCGRGARSSGLSVTIDACSDAFSPGHWCLHGTFARRRQPFDKVWLQCLPAHSVRCCCVLAFAMPFRAHYRVCSVTISLWGCARIRLARSHRDAGTDFAESSSVIHSTISTYPSVTGVIANRLSFIVCEPVAHSGTGTMLLELSTWTRTPHVVHTWCSVLIGLRTLNPNTDRCNV